MTGRPPGRLSYGPGRGEDPDKFWAGVRDASRRERLGARKTRPPHPWETIVRKLAVGEARSIALETIGGVSPVERVKQFAKREGIHVRVAASPPVLIIHRVATEDEARVRRGKYGEQDEQ
jgi:hypothetical protein